MRQGSFSPETAILTVDLGLELRRRSKAFEAAGKSHSAGKLLAQSAQHLVNARLQLPKDGRLSELLSMLLDIDSTKDTEHSNLDTIITELELAVQAMVDSAAPPESTTAPTEAAHFEVFGGRATSRDHTASSGTAKSSSSSLGESYASDNSAGSNDINSPLSQTLQSQAGALQVLGIDDAQTEHVTMRRIRHRYIREVRRCRPDEGSPEERELAALRLRELSSAYAILQASAAAAETGRGSGQSKAKKPTAQPAQFPSEASAKAAVTEFVSEVSPPKVSPQVQPGILRQTSAPATVMRIGSNGWRQACDMRPVAALERWNETPLSPAKDQPSSAQSSACSPGGSPRVVSEWRPGLASAGDTPGATAEADRRNAPPEGSKPVHARQISGSSAPPDLSPKARVKRGATARLCQCLASPLSMRRGASPAAPVNNGEAEEPLPQDQPPRLARDFTRGEMLGHGSYGCVFAARHQSSGRLVAVKEMFIDRSCGTNQDRSSRLVSLTRELRMCEQLEHQRIVRYLGHEFVIGSGCVPGEQGGPERVYLFLEFCSGGSLAAQLRTYGPLAMPLLRKYVGQLVEGLCYLHLQTPPVVHRDLKCANLLLTQGGDVKISDFGCSRWLTSEAPGEQGEQSVVGSVFWMAPELLRGRSVLTTAVDVWSLGCCVLEMASGKAPWSERGFDNILHACRVIAESGELPVFPDQLVEDHAAAEFTIACLRRNPPERPDTPELQRYLDSTWEMPHMEESRRSSGSSAKNRAA